MTGEEERDERVRSSPGITLSVATKRSAEMRLHAIVLVILGVLTFSSAPAMAGMHFSVFGDGTFSTTSTTGATNPDAKLGYGGGAQIEFGLGPMAGLEIGAVYLGRKNEQVG